MIPIKVYDVVHNAIRINMTDERFFYGIEDCPSNKINSIDYVNEDGTIGFLLTHPNQRIEMNGKTYHMNSAYDVDAFIQTFNTLIALEDLK
jgi:hypothetical protein